MRLYKSRTIEPEPWIHHDGDEYWIYETAGGKPIEGPFRTFDEAKRRRDQMVAQEQGGVA